MNTQQRLRKIIESKQGKYRADKLDFAQARAVEQAFAQATALQNNKQLDAARDIYQRIIGVEPHHPTVWYHLSLIDFVLKNWAGAENSALTALECLPQFYPAWVTLANIQYERREYAAAMSSVDRALSLKPQNIEALISKGDILWRIQEYEESEKFYRAALEQEKKQGTPAATTWRNLGHALSSQNKMEEAIEAYEEALKLDPESSELPVALANLYRVNNRTDKAIEHLHQAITRDPENINAHRCLSTMKNFTVEDSDLAALENLEKAEGHDSSWKSQLYFALGKAYADIKDDNKSFEKYLEANRLVRQRISYSKEETESYFDSIIRLFTPELMKRLGDKGTPSTQPIFIIGMPRSGTTLTEQILASHPDVFGAGELKAMAKAVVKNTRTDPYQIPQRVITKEMVKALTPEKVHAIGDDYLAATKKICADSPFITDKMPFNFTLAGLIRLALPHAKIIHTKRDPLDTCVSCFTHHFPETPAWKYDLTDMGHFYTCYEKLMAHWHTLFGDKILDVQYETLVEEPEAQIRRILDFCGLEWNAQCLDFHKTERAVRTASTGQVRNPLYKSGMQRWKKYEKHLQPLIDSLK